MNPEQAALVSEIRALLTEWGRRPTPEMLVQTIRDLFPSLASLTLMYPKRPNTTRRYANYSSSTMHLCPTYQKTEKFMRAESQGHYIATRNCSAILKPVCALSATKDPNQTHPYTANMILSTNNRQNPSDTELPLSISPAPYSSDIKTILENTAAGSRSRLANPSPNMKQSPPHSD